MPRKAFVADVALAAERNIPGISNVGRGADDNEVIVGFATASGVLIEITMMAQPDVGSYPSESMFMAFTDTPDVPEAVSKVIEDISTFSFGIHLPELIATISSRIQGALATGSRDDPVAIDDDEDVEMVDADKDEEEESEEEDYEGYYSDDGFGEDPIRNGSTSHSTATLRLSPENASKINRRIRSDLRAAKFAAYTVGILGGMKAESVSSILCLSVRVAKLGLSEEAVQAWDLEPQQYILLLIRYSNGYKSFEDIINDPAKSHDVSFRIGVGNKYKCTLVEALAAFTELAKDSHKTAGDDAVGGGERAKADVAGFTNIFISSSLNDFINNEFISLLKIRSSLAIGWDGAKMFFNDKQGRLDEANAELPPKYYVEDPTQKENILPDLVTADHLTDHQVKITSFPLLAAQFAMRYLTRCTEFCLVCHDRIGEEFEALKPYVCSKPLCLYQYMSLGFGPSVEHEILTQPYVVDLLLSFCYASAVSQRLREYPTGMSLSVPPVAKGVTNPYVGMRGMPGIVPPSVDTASISAAPSPGSDPTDVKFDYSRQEVTFDSSISSPVRNGEWIVVTAANRTSSDHYRVEDISLFPLVKLASTAVNRIGRDAPVPIVVPSTIPVTPATTPPPPSLVPAILTIYNQNFDEMTDVEKAETIAMLLETLPSIREMRSFLLTQSRTSEPNLRAWKERVSPAALGILRWIIASNRSCIVQVDRCPGQSEAELAMSNTRLDQRVSGIAETWVQFRFAQGSPDKEQRFLNALKAEQANLDPKYPTIFAFHGSPMPNWHSIIRSGLDFKETLHGRAYGHGVYHALEQAVSVGYAQPNASMWHGSELKISSAMSLNEIVNCPDKFASSTPYLVVQHIDWIQCRYLFVQVQSPNTEAPGVASAIIPASDPMATEVVEQDPKRIAKSTRNNVAIGVPLCAVSVSRAFRVSAKAAETPASKRRKHGSGSKLSVPDLVTSDGENVSDIEFLFSDDEEGLVILNSKASKVPTTPLTDFIAGSLDQSTLPMLQPPMYATSMATKTLNRNLKEVLAIQAKTPLHELGWYLNPDLVSNVYQWIVELHSFDAELPLAKDMKTAGVTSIVLEIRFGKDYPFTPPFVRVIRPRFLPFASGGGGHVTAGGAMCMELLTNTGWTSVSTIESVLLQVRVEMMSLERPAHLESTTKAHQRDYGTAEAIDAYERSCKVHGWAIPPGFRDFASSSTAVDY